MSRKPQQFVEEKKVEEHAKSLGFNTTKEYFVWCRNNRFKATLRKTHNNLKEEEQLVVCQTASAVMKERRTFRKPKNAIEKLFSELPTS